MGSGEHIDGLSHVHVYYQHRPWAEDVVRPQPHADTSDAMEDNKFSHQFSTSPSSDDPVAYPLPIYLAPEMFRGATPDT